MALRKASEGYPRELQCPCGAGACFEEESGLHISGTGELVDDWVTPLFFHRLSGAEMELHSAGPDEVTWTADDLVAR